MLFPAQDLGKRTKMSVCPFAHCKSKWQLHSCLLPVGSFRTAQEGAGSRIPILQEEGGRRLAQVCVQTAP